MTSQLTSSSTVFGSSYVEQTIKDVLEAYLRNVKYDPIRCSRLSHDLCSIIKAKTKETLQRRLPAAAAAGADIDEVNGRKLVVHVVLGQDSDQSVLLSSRCIWNASTDTLASATYRNNSVFAVCVVYELGRS
jgi:hypothetical protein